MKKIMFVFVILLLASTACQAKPDQVALKLAEMTNSQDLEGALALFTEDAVVNSGNPATYTGKAEIQGWLEEMFADNCQIEAEIVAVQGNVVTTHDRLTMDSLQDVGVPSVDGTNVITVKDDKIKKLNFTYSRASAAVLQEATMKGLILSQMELTNNGQIAEQLLGIRDDAIVTIDGKPYIYHQFTGKESIGAFLQTEAEGGFYIEQTAVMTVKGNEVVLPSRFALDAFGSMGIEWIVGTDTYVLVDGKIQSHTWTISEESLAALQAVLPPPLTIDALAGTWEWDIGGQAIRQQYQPDGTYEMTHQIGGEWFSWDKGQFRLDGALLTGYTLTLTSDDESKYCAGGAVGQVGVFMNETGQLAVVQGEDECLRRAIPVSDPMFGDRVTP